MENFVSSFRCVNCVQCRDVEIQCICACVSVTLITVLTIHCVWRVQIYRCWLPVAYVNREEKKCCKLHTTPACIERYGIKFTGILVNAFVLIGLFISHQNNNKKKKQSIGIVCNFNRKINNPLTKWIDRWMAQFFFSPLFVHVENQTHIHTTAFFVRDEHMFHLYAMYHHDTNIHTVAKKTENRWSMWYIKPFMPDQNVCTECFSNLIAM